ncbi:MAG TPA: DMT family transporter [Xanthobacteraceae bacterium]|nr:DMT family transporter [Xanthobacteraceae bacterium]
MQSALRRFGGFLFDSPYLLLSLSSLFWAGNIVLGRFIAGRIPPLALSWFRWTGAFLIFIGFAWPYVRRDWQAIRANTGILLLIALVGISAYSAVSYSSQQYTQAINALLIASTGPLLVALATFVLYREPPTARQMFGVLISLCGVLVVICRGDLEILRKLQFNAGDLGFFFAQIIYAFYTALLKQKPALHPFSFLAAIMGWGALLLTPAYALEAASGRTPSFGLAAVLTLVYMATLPSLVAYLFYNRGVELIGPNRAAPFYHLIPIFGSVLAILFLGERPEFYHAIGYALVFTGVAVATTSTAAAKPA